MRHVCATLLLSTAWIAACSPGPLAAPEAPVHDTAPPRLDVRAPLRGTIQPGATHVVVRGTALDDDSGLASLTVAGQRVELAADGSFSASVPLGEGITLVRTVAVDGEGNEQSDTRAVLAGHLVPVETRVAEGIALRLDAAALRSGAEIGARRLEALDVQALLARKNPLFDLDGCLGARVELTRATKGAVHLSVTPTGGGLAIDADLADVSVSMHVAWSLFCKDGQADITASARHFRLRGTVLMGVGPDGKFTSDASDTEATFDGFDLDTSLLPDKVTDFLETPVGDTLAFELGELVKAQVPELLLRGLGGRASVLGAGQQTLDLSLVPRILTLSPAGVELVVDSSLFLHGSPGAVYPVSPAARPGLDPRRGVGVAIADDALNQMLASLWSAGVLDRSFSPGGAGGGITALFDTVELGLRLPPVLTAGPDGLRLTAGDVEAYFLGAGGHELGRMSMSLEARLAVTIVDDHLALALSDATVNLDLLRDGAGAGPLFAHADVQTIGDFLAVNLVSLVGKLVADVPLPATSGISVPAASLSSGGAGYVVVQGDVGPR